MNSLIARFYAASETSRRHSLLAVSIVACVAVLAVSVAGLRSLSPYVGGLAGALLYGVALTYYRNLMSSEQRDKVNLKNRFPLPGRRIVVLGALAVWLICLLLVSRVIPIFAETTLGTINVFILISLYVLIRDTPEGRLRSLTEEEESSSTER